MSESKNLYQRLLAITEEIGKIDKTGTNQQQGYKFIEQAQVVAEVRVQLAKHGVMIIPETTGRTVEAAGQTAKGTTIYHATVTSRYTLVNADNPDDKMVCEWDAGEALDMSDKATNKATTASHKYFLMKLFNISDKNDPDTETVEAAQKPAEPSRTTAAELIHPEVMKELRTALSAASITGAYATQFAEKIIGHSAPRNNDEAKKLIDEVKKLEAAGLA